MQQIGIYRENSFAESQKCIGEPSNMKKLFIQLIFMCLTASSRHILRDDEIDFATENETRRANCTLQIYVKEFCERVTLTPEEYSVQCGSMNVTEFVEDKNITCCFPYKREFAKCVKWKLDSYEFEIAKNILYEINNERNYGLGDYRINYDRSAHVCVPKHLLPTIWMWHLDFVFFIFCVVSAIFLSTSFVTYIICPFRRHDSKSLICHMTSVLSLLVVSLTFQVSANVRHAYFCVLATFFTFASYNWLNVVSYDMWDMFRPKKTFSRPQKCFLLRFLYAWGVSGLILCVEFVLKATKVIEEPLVITPGYYSFTWPTIYYFVCLSFMQSVNVVAYVLTFHNIRNATSETAKNYVEVSEKIISLYRQLFVVSSFIYGLVCLQRIPIHWIISVGVDLLLVMQGVYFFQVYGTNSTFKQCCRVIINRNKGITE